MDRLVINDIAHAAHVSKTTISRYLNGKYEYMSQETRDRIKQIIESTHYRPNKLASSLKSNRSRQIGLLIADISRPVSAILARGISDICSESEFTPLIYSTDGDLEKECNSVENLLDQQVEGILVNPADFVKSLDAFENRNIPFVMIDRKVNSDHFDSVVTDSKKATLKAVKHLYDQGFRNLALFSENPVNVSTRFERIESFSEFYKAKINNNVEKAIFIIDPKNQEQVERYITELVADSKGSIPAIFTVNELCMLAVLAAVQKLGLQIPDDISVCGYDEWPCAPLIAPGITTIAQQSYEVGAQAAKLLISKINKTDGQDESAPVCHVLKSSLIVRGSTTFKG